MTEWICVVCNQVFDDIALENAVQITSDHGRGRSRTQTYRFLSDGSFHHLRKVKAKKQPLTAPELPATSAGSEELLQEVENVLAKLPTPPVPEPELKPEPFVRIEESEEQNTAMAFAFRRAKGNQYAET